MVVFSRLKTTNAQCNEFFHPYEPSCTKAAVYLTKDAFQESLRIYIMAYALGLALRRRIPSKRDLQRTIFGILQSSVFLTTNATGYSSFVCIVRWVLGSCNALSASFIPSFLASFVAIIIERPSRRGLLSLYVTNVASETLFRMAVARKWVKPIKYGEIIIFSLSIAQLLHFYRGNHISSDPIFGFLRFLVGPCEESGYEPPVVSDITPKQKKYSGKNVVLKNYVKLYNYWNQMIAKLKSLSSHVSCPHPNSCLHYVVGGGGRMFALGYAFQLCLKILLQQRRIFRNPNVMKNIIFSLDTMRLGFLFASFSIIFRGLSCSLRRQLGHDSKDIAYPAGLLAGLSFILFRDNTVALYFMWKVFNIFYNKAVEKGYMIDIPFTTEILYSVSTAVLFHSGVLEPTTLRPSYWRFLKAISGNRLEKLGRTHLELFGYNTLEQFKLVMDREKTRR